MLIKLNELCDPWVSNSCYMETKLCVRLCFLDLIFYFSIMFPMLCVYVVIDSLQIANACLVVYYWDNEYEYM